MSNKTRLSLSVLVLPQRFNVQALASLVTRRGLQQLDAGHFQVLIAGLRDAGWEAGADRPSAPAALADGSAPETSIGDSGGKDLDDARLTGAFAEPYRALQVCIVVPGLSVWCSAYRTRP